MAERLLLPVIKVLNRILYIINKKLKERLI